MSAPLELKETAQSFRVLHGTKLVMSWPGRLWEPCGHRDGRTLWSSRARTREEIKQLKRRITRALPGPRATLCRRLLKEIAEDEPHGLTRKPEKVPTESRKSYFTLTEREHGRPHNLPPVYREACTVREVGQWELATGNISRHAMRVIAAATTDLLEIDGAARQLSLTPTLLRELIWECLHPIPPKPRPPQPRRYHWSGVPQLPDESLPLRDRVRFLWYRGEHESGIAYWLKVPRLEIRKLTQPRHGQFGPCKTCVNYYARQTTPLHIFHCGHYGVSWEFVGEHVRKLKLTAAEYLAQLRAVAPKPTAVFSARERQRSGFVWRLSKPRKPGPRTLEDDFEDIMVMARRSNAEMADEAGKLWKRGARKLTNCGGEKTDEREPSTHPARHRGRTD